MEFGLALYLDNTLKSKSSSVIELSNDLKAHLKEKSFGEGVQEMYIGVVSVSPQFEQFFKHRKPKYTKEKTEKNRDEVKTAKEFCLELDVVIDYEKLKSATEGEVKNLVLNTIVKSLRELPLPNIKNFSLSQLLSDLSNFLVLKNLK